MGKLIDAVKAFIRDMTGLLEDEENLDSENEAETSEDQGEGEDMEDRSVAWGDIGEQINSALWQMGGSYWLTGVFTNDDGQTYAIATSEGLLYRFDVTLSSGQVTLGEAQPVEVQHVPATRSIKIIRQQEDGKEVIRFVGVACTAVLNKDTELDSSALFDDFVERFQERNLVESPVVLDFFHTDIRLGEVDFIAREGYVLIDSGVIDDTPLGRATAAALEDNPDYWGQSIMYEPLAPPTLLRVSDDMEFPIWEKGSLERVAVLPNRSAAAWFTSVNLRSKNMDENKFEALKELVGEELANQIVENSDEINSRVSQSGLIAREQDDDSQEREADNEPEAENPHTAQQVTEAESEQANDNPIVNLRSVVSELVDRVAELTTTVNESLPELTERVKSLELERQEREAAWQADSPARSVLPIVRPRQVREAVDEDEEVTSSAKAHKTLASIGLAHE